MLFIQLFLTNRPTGENLPATPHLWDFYMSTFLIWFFLFFFLKAYQDDITSDLAHVAKWDHVLFFSS